MILPIFAYGSKVLRKKADDVDSTYPELAALIENMWTTMYHAQGVGLAAPQVGHSIRLFIIDTIQLNKEEDETGGIKQVFINPEKMKENGEQWTYEEGCLSIPNVRGDVDRPEKVILSYYDENFVQHTQEFENIEARVIQHEFDHLEGILFTQHLKPVKRRLIKRKLENIRKGDVDVEYPMVFV
ncbi:MAG: peptide deformylase [Saprospiraceae bacterium]|nr:peptide deformylase [Saprospiraceae bacterium]